MLSHYFHSAATPRAARGRLHPPDLLAEVRARAVAPEDVDARCSAQFVDLSVAECRATACRGAASWWSARWRPTSPTSAAGAVLRAAYDPPFFATYFYGLDVVGHTFLRFAAPRPLRRRPPGGAPPLRRRGRRATPPTRARRSAELAQGAAPGRGAARGLRLRHAAGAAVAAGLGGAGRRPVDQRHARRRAGRRPPRGRRRHPPRRRPSAGASVLDVAPTILYLMGLPVARDMEGRVLTEMLDEASPARTPSPSSRATRAWPSRPSGGRVPARPAARCPTERPVSTVYDPRALATVDEFLQPRRARGHRGVGGGQPRARASRAFALRIDFGELGVRTSSAQISDLYETADLVGLQVVAVVNFPPRQVAGVRLGGAGAGRRQRPGRARAADAGAAGARRRAGELMAIPDRLPRAAGADGRGAARAHAGPHGPRDAGAPPRHRRHGAGRRAHARRAARAAAGPR